MQQILFKRCNGCIADSLTIKQHLFFTSACKDIEIVLIILFLSILAEMFNRLLLLSFSLEKKNTQSLLFLVWFIIFMNPNDVWNWIQTVLKQWSCSQSNQLPNIFEGNIRNVSLFICQTFQFQDWTLNKHK